MKKYLTLTTVFFFMSSSFTTMAYAEDIVTTLKDSTLVKYSEKPFRDLWAVVKPEFKSKYAQNIDAYLKHNKNVKIPQITVTRLYGSGVRLILKTPKQIMTIEFINDDHVAAMVNGIAFTHQDMKSFDTIMEKLITDFYINKKKNVAVSDDVPLSVWAFLFMGSRAEAAECANVTGKLCWDTIDSKSGREAIFTLRRLQKENNISVDELKSYLVQIEASRNECVQKKQACTNIESRYAILKSAIEEPPRLSPQGQPPQPRAEFVTPPVASASSTSSVTTSTSAEEKSGFGKFWSDNSSWLMPTLIISGVILGGYALCRTGVIKIFSCGKNDSSSTDSSTLSLAIPQNTTPTAELYTGTATK